MWTTPGAEPFEGSVVDRTDQSVTLSIKGMPQPVVVPRDSITRFDVSRGRRSRSKTALTPLLGARLTLRF